MVTVNVDGEWVQWLVPIAHVHIEFGKQLQKVGCPLSSSVGAPSVGGLFSSISKAYKSATRAVKKLVPKAVKRAASSVVKAATKGASAAYRGAQRYARDAVHVAKRLKDPRQLGLAALTGGQSLLAQTRAQQNLLKVARNIPGPIGTAASVARAGGSQLANVARGRRVDFGGLAADLAQAGVNYVPGGAALTSTPLGRTAFSSALNVARGERLDRALKKAVLREVHVPGFGGLAKSLPLPNSAQLNQARRVWHAVHQGERAARRLQAGRALPWDDHRLRHGQQTMAGLRHVIARARAGHLPAAHALHAFRRVGAIL